MRRSLLSLGLLLLAIVVPVVWRLPALAAGGSARPRVVVMSDAEFFEGKVRPILNERCQKCHSSASGKHKGGLFLDSRAALLRGGDSGPAVVAGRPEKSLLVKAVRYDDDILQMPPGGKLPAEDVTVLEQWVRRGARFAVTATATPGAETAAATTTHKGVDPAEGRKFWSFRPPHTFPLPAVREAAWPRRRIDSFVLASLDGHGLTHSAPASRRTLIRRVTFDLTGLPPDPAEVERFVADPDPDAYEKMVERLLASPSHGERWGRFWLDLARYCDVAESWAEAKGQPWRYRDWVIAAFNDDLPYDRFVQMQLAADVLPEAKPRDRAALGFLGLSPTFWKELKLAPGLIEAVVADEWEERIHTICGTFLGLTVACARCHDHKFDPITQQDYYALAGVLCSTRGADLLVMSDAELSVAEAARAHVQQLEAQAAKLEVTRPAPPDADKQVRDLKAEAEAVKRTTPYYDLPRAPAVADASLFVLPDGISKTKLEYRPGVARDVAVQVRGNPLNPGPVVARRFLACLCSDPPKPFERGSGRAELANSLVTEGAPLSARVIVNRVWANHFGAGLVETPSDFGAAGARPTHPELLDDLTARFIEAGWSIKWLHREILLSATYRQASDYHAAKQTADPSNRWLWRMNRRRLEVEAWRDAMLAVTGTLQSERGGPSLELGDPKNCRRTVYGTVKRHELNDLLRLNDFPDPVTHNPCRLPTITPIQQLSTLNGPLIRQQAVALARRLLTETPGGVGEKVQRAYAFAYGRPATEAEVKLASEFLASGDEVAWQQYCQALLGSNEFLFVE
jgi:hypothetical protein